MTRAELSIAAGKHLLEGITRDARLALRAD